MTEYPFVSIVIPAYNAEKTICNCLESIMALDYPHDKFEVIVVDNGSTDATLKIANKYASAVLVEPDLTVGGLRNKGVSLANGVIIAFTDSDCVVSRNWLRSAVNLLSEDETLGKTEGEVLPVGVVTGRIGIPDDATWVIKTWALNRGKQQDDKIVGWASSMNMIILKDLFFQVNGFSEKLETCEDVDLSEKVRCTDDYVILYSEDVKVIHLGEAKSIGQLFKKEYWRGRGAFALLRDGRQSVRDLRYFFQIILFSFSGLGGLFSFFFYNNVYVWYFLFGHILLPLLRAVIISMKINSLKAIGALFYVWYVYYCARASSFWAQVFVSAWPLH